MIAFACGRSDERRAINAGENWYAEKPHQISETLKTKLKFCVYMKKLYVAVILSFCLAGSVFAQSTNNGVDLYRAGKYAESVSLLEKVISSVNAVYLTGVYLGAGYVKTGNKARAAETFKQADKLTKGTSTIKYDRPVKIIEKRPPAWEENAKAGMSSGGVDVAVEFQSDGTIGFVFPFRSSPRTLVPAVIEAARAIKFEPAILNGKPVTSVMLFSYEFEHRYEVHD
jgi:hypothetical protein